MVTVSLPQRMRKLQQRLLDIRIGSGALILPKDIKRIHLRFAPKINGGHQGPRQFWRNELIRLKYHNPAIPMSVDRSAAQTDQALLSIHFAPADAPQTSDSATSSPAAVDSTSEASEPSDAASTDRVETVDMTNITNTQILAAVVRLTRAYPVAPTAQDKEEMRSLEEQRERSLRDSKLSQQVRARQKREREMLEQARGDMATA